MPDLPTIDSARVTRDIGPMKEIYTSFSAYKSKKFLVFAIALGLLGFNAVNLLNVADTPEELAEATNLFVFFTQVSIGYIVMQGIYDCIERWCQMRERVANIQSPQDPVS